MSEIGRRRRPDASMTLLTEVMERPLDPGYAAAARKRAAGQDPGPSLRRRLIVLILAVVMGFGAVVAAAQLRTPGPSEGNARDLLIEQIRERSATGEQLRAGNAELREEISALQSQVLGPDAEEFLARTAELEMAVGAVGVQGPGVVVTLEDSARATSGEPGSEDERVQDFDLQVVVNGLWAAGAEAVSVNGHRLTALTAIRTAGSAILVDLQPLVSPYRIEAIGDPDGMRAHFAASSAQGHLNALSSAYSISSSVSTEGELRLNGTTSTQLRYAQTPR